MAQKEVFIQFPFDKNLVFAEDHYQRLSAMTKYPVYDIPAHTAVYDLSGETSTNSNNINIARAYIHSWKTIFADKAILNLVRKFSRLLLQIEKWNVPQSPLTEPLSTT